MRQCCWIVAPFLVCAGSLPARAQTAPPLPPVEIVRLSAVDDIGRVTLANGQSVHVLGLEAMADDPACVEVARARVRELVADGDVRVEVDPFFEHWRLDARESRTARHVRLSDGRLLAPLVLATGCARMPSWQGPYPLGGQIWSAWMTAQTANRQHYRVQPCPSCAPRVTEAAARPLSWSGNGSKETQIFTVTAPEWRVRWYATPSTPEVGGILTIEVVTADGASVTSITSGDVTAPRSDVSYVRASGRFYLRIRSAVLAQWSVAVESADVAR